MLCKRLEVQTWFVQFGGPEEIYDVYVNRPEPLDEGVEKHVISVFVADESGIINRVAGVFARRGAAPLHKSSVIDLLGDGMGSLHIIDSMPAAP